MTRLRQMINYRFDCECPFAQLAHGTIAGYVQLTSACRIFFRQDVFQSEPQARRLGQTGFNPHGLSHIYLWHARLPFHHSPALSMVLLNPD